MRVRERLENTNIALTIGALLLMATALLAKAADGEDLKSNLQDRPRRHGFRIHRRP